MTDQLFDRIEFAEKLCRDQPCGQQGTIEAWQVRGKTQRPRCNRPPGHEGQHRKYKLDGNVVAEWDA